MNADPRESPALQQRRSSEPTPALQCLSRGSSTMLQRPGAWIYCEEDQARRPVSAGVGAASLHKCSLVTSALLCVGFSTRRWLARIVRHLHARKL